MPYSPHDRYASQYDRECGCCEGITAPYCPPPACPPPKPMKPMDGCPHCQQHDETSAAKHKPSKRPLPKASVWPRPVQSCPPAHYSGVICPAPAMKPAKPKNESVLLQKIVCCERRSIPQLCTELELERLSECAMPPFRLVSVQASGAQPWWTPMESHGPDTRNHIRVYIPVCCQVYDCEGKVYHATSVVQTEISFRSPCNTAESWRSSIFIIPCVRLLGEAHSEDCRFCVQLEIHLEVYLLKPEPCAMHRPEPPCPELPLYPSPPDWRPRFHDWPGHS